MEQLLLDGEWVLEAEAGPIPEGVRARRLPAAVPGCVHTDLLRAGLVSDPYWRDAEKEQFWVGRATWRYRREFDIESEFLQRDRVELVLDGVDTLATVSLNESEILRTNNQFRSYRVDVRPYVKEGRNRICVRFAPPITSAEEADRKQPLYSTGLGHHRLPGAQHLRKSQCNFGWDWGPMCPTSGIWRSVYLQAIDGWCVRDLHVRQYHGTMDEPVRLELVAELARGSHSAAASSLSEVPPSREGPEALDGQTESGPQGPAGSESSSVPADGRIELVVQGGHSTEQLIGSQQVAVEDNGTAKAWFTVEAPAYWWPNGMGDQPLYRAVVRLYGSNGEVEQEVTRTFGIRVVELDTGPDGSAFAFEVNGRSFFAKGANWIPADTFVTRLAEQDYERLVKDAAAVGMNMLRVWGGGIYEADAFYDACDRYGILVWQDFMFACSAYPSGDAFFHNVRAEAVEAVRRLRTHACLALWCGNNEMEQILPCIEGAEGDREQGMGWDAYQQLFDGILKDVVDEHDPETPYWPSSPHTPGSERRNANDPEAGDAHVWEIWHGREPFETYRRSTHRFISEFGFQSFPEPQAIARFTEVTDRNVTSRIMEHHQRSPIGNQAIMHYMLDWFRLPESNEMVFWVSQILQGLAMKYGVEHWRGLRPRTMGTLYWQLNDCWPAASWASIDWHGAWKALHYMARDFYAPLLLLAKENAETQSVSLEAVSDLPDGVQCDVRWWLQTVGGEDVSFGVEDVFVEAEANTAVVLLDFDEQCAQLGAENLLFFAEMWNGEKRVSRNFASFVRPKHLALEDPGLELVTERDRSGSVRATITVERPALWVWPELAGHKGSVPPRYSDRFFCMRARTSETVVITPSELDVATGASDGSEEEGGHSADPARRPAGSASKSPAGEENYPHVVVRSLIDTYRGRT